ncbi:MAG TPA: SHOCT domain-containing protein [Spirochaetia bacterium]|nr:SHOCT domain-containing protein [Spirochaetia bacterium]
MSRMITFYSEDVEMWGWGWMHGGYGLPFWLVGAGFRLVVLAALAVGIVFLIRRYGRHDWRRPREESPLDILQKRYARGEIDKEQYEEMKRNIG